MASTQTKIEANNVGRHQPIAYTFDQAAELIGIPRNTLRDAHSRGEFRAKKVGKRWLVLRSELERWLQS